MIKLFSILLVSVNLFAIAPINKLDFYSAFKSDEKSILDKEIARLNKFEASSLKDAYLGVLIMKNSQFQSTPSAKLKAFKEGKVLLEGAIAKEPKNGEFRFLRLAIQEKSPKLLKYDSNMDEDKEILLDTYSSLDFTVKKVIKAYAEKSMVISPKDFK